MACKLTLVEDNPMKTWHAAEYRRKVLQSVEAAEFVRYRGASEKDALLAGQAVLDAYGITAKYTNVRNLYSTRRR